MTGDAEMSTHDLDEVRIPLGCPDSGHVADEPKEEARDPKAQTDAECSRERAVDDGDGARRTAHQDRFGQARCTGVTKPGISASIKSPLPRRTRRTTKKSSTLRTRSIGRTRSG